MKLQKMNVPINQKAYITPEPTWDKKFKEDDRKVNVLKTFNWYSRLFGYTEASTAIEEYLLHTDRAQDAKLWKKLPSRALQDSYGWYARMITKGYPATKEELKTLHTNIDQALTKMPAKAQVVETEAQKEKKKANIQEIMIEKTMLLGGELEYLLDCFIDEGCKLTHKLSPINEIKLANILPQHIPLLTKHWEKVVKEYEIAYNGKDKELLEGYSNFTKIQLRNLVKFSNLVLSDLLSYTQFKKVTKAPRKRKILSPGQIVNKLKYAKKFEELKLKSLKPEKIIGAKEIYVYSTKKRKLHRYIADSTVGALSVKGNTVIGFDPTKTVMKTIRNPKKQVQEFVKAGRPATRKYFDSINAVEAKLSGRFADDLLILKIF